MPHFLFKYLVRYLNKKIGKQGKDIELKELKMKSYLSPQNTKINNEDRKLMYSLRNATIIFNNTFEETKCNFGCVTKNEETKCNFGCITKNEVKHLFSCKYLNKEEKNITLKKNSTMDHLIDNSKYFTD